MHNQCVHRCTRIVLKGLSGRFAIGAVYLFHPSLILWQLMLYNVLEDVALSSSNNDFSMAHKATVILEKE